VKFAERGPSTWTERDENGDPLGYVVLYGGWLVERANRRASRGQVILPGGKRFRRSAIDRTGPWRWLMVRVTPQGMEAFWENEAGGVERVSQVSAATVRANFLDHHRTQPALAPFRPDFHPRGGMGLYIVAGKACFRDIVVEPLPAGQ
jgi:hypothetical protein